VTGKDSEAIGRIAEDAAGFFDKMPYLAYLLRYEEPIFTPLIMWVATMRDFAEKAKRFLLSEDGPTAVEYAIILGLIVLVCFASISIFGNRTSRSLSNSASSLP
jgi:pilus assembly protein Flp/PilA